MDYTHPMLATITMKLLLLMQPNVTRNITRTPEHEINIIKIGQ